VFKVDPQVQKEQTGKLRKIKSERDSDRARSTLNKLKQKAQTEENLVYGIMDCVEAYATVGEICDVLREVWGEHKEQTIL